MTDAVINAGGQALLILDRADRVRSVTPAAAALLGLAAPQLLGRHWPGLPLPDGIIATRRTHEFHEARHIRRLRLVTLETAADDPDARERWLAPWADSAELALLRAPDGRVLAANSAFARKFGLVAGAWCGRDPLDWIHPDDAADWRRTAAQLQASPHQAAHEHRWQTAQGWRWLAWEEQAVRSPSGALLATRAIGRDVTRRRLAEEHFQKLASIVEQTQISIVLTMPDGRVEYVNPRFTQVTGLTLEEIFEQNIEVLRSGFQGDADYADFLRTLRGGKVWRGEFQTISKRGEARWESAHVSAIQDHRDRITHLLCLREDITDRKLLEAQLRQAQKMEVLGMLAGGISHDFNNLLAIISGFCEMAFTRAGDDEKLDRYLKEIHKATKRASGLVRQILGFSRKPEDGVSFVKLSQLVDDTARLLKETLSRDIDIVVETTAGIPGVRADPNQLQQIVMNLCVNARDAMPDGGTLTLRTARQSGSALSRLGGDAHGQYVTIEIADTGCGMTPEVRARIFEPFYTTKDQSHGTGLGLAVVMGIISGHGGLIEVDSTPGKGTAFRVHLPLLGQGDTASAVIEADTPAPIPGGTETILVVEDEAGVRDLLGASLESAGYKVLDAADGAQALDYFLRGDHHIDAVVLDLNLPRLTGLQVREFLRNKYPGIGLVIASGHVPPELRASIEQAGDAIIIGKPFSLATLGNALREVLDRVPAPAA